MNMIKLTFAPSAQKEIHDLLKSGNEPAIHKFKELLNELKAHPQTGEGQPEALHGKLEGLWSRRINHEDRLIYQIQEEPPKVIVLSIKGHYEDFSHPGTLPDDIHK